MNSPLYVPQEIVLLFIFFSVFIIGLVHIVSRIRSLNQEKNFAEEFSKKLKQYYSESQGKDMEVYSWLIHRSPKMQTVMGGIGIAHNYKPPYENYMISNYHIIVNTLPELRKSLDDSLFRDLAYEYFILLQETLLRYTGVLDDQLDSQKRYLKNPIVWFREGVRSVLLVPLLTLEWAGLITSATVSKFSRNFLFNLLTGAITLIGLIGSIITIIIGWEQFQKIVSQFLGFI